MTNREMLDKYKELIIQSMTIAITHHDLRYIGSALEKYFWMNNELKENEKDKKEDKI